MDKAIRKRLSLLELGLKPNTCFCIVKLPDGTQAEKTMEEWYQNSAEWRLIRMTKGGNNAAVMLLLAAIGNECAESAMQAGDVAGAARLTAEAAHYLAEYERMTR